jgi:hypothetical protein
VGWPRRDGTRGQLGRMTSAGSWSRAPGSADIETLGHSDGGD